MASGATSRVHFFTGKGGVGKSTLVAGVAVAAAAEGLRPLVAELGHRATMKTIFGRTIGYAPVEVAPGVHALNMELDAALADYVAEHAPRAIAQRVVRLPALRRFFSAAPAVAELATLQRLRVLRDEGWNPILVDLDATGHARMFLSTPRVLGGLATKPPLRDVLQSVRGLLDESRLHLVTVPSELPSLETAETHRSFSESAEVGLGVLVVNRMPRRPLGDAEVASLGALAAAMPAEVQFAKRLLRRAARAEHVLRRLKQLEMPTVQVPEYDGEIDLREMGAEVWGRLDVGR